LFYYIVKHPKIAEVAAALVSEEIPAWCASVSGSVLALLKPSGNFTYHQD
jgi:hypothetical protein